MNHFTSRQMLLVLGFLLPLSRMILFPASLAFSSGTSGILVVATCMILEVIVCVFIILMWKKSKLSYFDLISRFFGNWIAKVVAILYILLFFAKLVLFLSSQKLMMFNVLYENVSQYVLFLPVVLLLGYAGSKNSNVVARVFEISAWLVVGAFIAIMLLSAPAVRVENFFPMHFDIATLRSAVAYPLYFGDFTFFLMFFGGVRKDFSSEWKMLFAWLINFAVTMLFIFVFFGVFGKLAVGGSYAISNLSKYAVAFSQIGRYDFLFILVVGFGFVVLALAVFHAMLSASDFTFGKRWIWSAIFAFLLYVAVFFASGNFEKVGIIFSKYLSGFAIILQFVLPCVIGIITAIKFDGKQKKEGKYEKSQSSI